MANIALLPGGFKPPHAGHYAVTKYLSQKSGAEVLVRVGAKERDSITQAMSIKIWDIYGVNAEPASSDSPIGDVFKYVEEKATEKDTIYVGTGEKDFPRFKVLTDPSFKPENYKKYNPKGVKVIEIPIPPQAGGVSGTKMREFIKNDQKDLFQKFLPDNVDKDKIWNIVLGLNESGADTSWEDEDGNKITLEDVLDLTKNIPIKNYPTEKLAKVVLNWDDNPEEVDRISQVEISKEYPILIMVDEGGKIKWILDGNHRAQKALRAKAETIPAKLIKPSNLDAKAKKIFNLEEDLYNPEDKVLDYMRGSEWKAGMPDGPKDDKTSPVIKYQRGGMYNAATGQGGAGTMYESKYYLNNSNIQGQGAFAQENYPEGTVIDKLHDILGQGQYNFYELGKMYNHSETPNCKNIMKNNTRYLVTIQPVRQGEELTADYRLQPDLEQPEHFLNELDKSDLKSIEPFADKQLNPVDVDLTSSHFFDRLNDPRNDKEISNAELIGFFKRLAKKKKELFNFLTKYKEIVASDIRTNINIPFLKQADKIIAKTILRKKDFQTSNPQLTLEKETINECWKGYVKKGMKKKGNKMVPNCVPQNEEVKYGASDLISQYKDKIQSDYGHQQYRDLQLMVSQQKDEEVNKWLKTKGYMNESKVFSKDWWSNIINEILLTEGGAAGHMAHPFDLPNVKSGRDLKNIFMVAATSLNTNPGSVKIDGVNASIRLITLDGIKQFVMDRGSKKELDIKGITKDDLLNRFGDGHGMVKIGGEVLDMFNTALPQIENDLKALGAWEDPNILFNMEYVSGKTNVQDYGSNFIAIHGLNKIESKEVQGKRKMLTKRVSSEVSYNKSALQSMLDNLSPTAKKQGFKVYGSVPTEMKKKPNFNSALSQNYSVESTEEVKTQPLSKWLDEVSAIPKDEFIFITRDNTSKKVGAVSKQVYQLILNGENIDDLFNDNDKKKAIDGFVTYLATEKLGDEVLKVLDSPMGSVENHEGVVIRDEKIASVPFKITGKFILGGLISDF